MALDKLVGFKLVIEWYAANQTALLWKDPLDADKQKAHAKAQLAVTHGNGTDIANEKIAAWRTAIRVFEKLWSHKDKDWPLVDKFENGNGGSTSPHIMNIQTILANLNAAFAPVGCKFRVTFQPEQEFLHGEILLPQAELYAMIPQAPLAVALNLVPTVAKVLAVTKDADGAEQFNGALFMQKLPEVLAHVSAWAGATDRITKPVGKAVKAAKAPRVPRVPGAPRAPRPAGTGSPRAKILDTQVIQRTAVVSTLIGKRRDLLNLVKSGMTVGQLNADAITNFGAKWTRSNTSAVLQVMVARNLITLN
jgi:hypothetical protein